MKKEISKASKKSTDLIVFDQIESLILEIRGHKVMLDVDLARLYGTTTKALNQAVKRNSGRFPKDFMFKLNQQELSDVVTICDHLGKLKFSHQMPSVFTEHGALMLASVLNSEIAIKASVEIVRAFVKMRSMLSLSKDLANKIDALEEKLVDHDQKFGEVFDAIRQLMLPTTLPKKQIGFQVDLLKK